jgi:cysteine desulfurase
MLVSMSDSNPNASTAGRRPDQPRVYADHAATTPPDPRVVEAMLPFLTHGWHNPSSIYVESQRVAAAIERSRERVASLLGASPAELIFTSGGSESNNLAIKGVVAANTERSHLVASAVEHHAVLDPVEQLEAEGIAEVTLVAPERDGSVHPDAVAAALRPDTALVSVMHANNEIGTINDLASIASIVHAHDPAIVVHSDAVQSLAHVGARVDELGVDMMTVTAHKLYGPRGAGALFVRSGTPLTPQILGGGQEQRRRAGTEDTAAIAGFATALELAEERRIQDVAHERDLQRRLLDELQRAIPMLGITGPTDLAHRLPGNVSCVIAFVEGESILLALDLAGIAASSGSACTTGSIEPSHVLTAIGMPPELARGSLRFSFGRLSEPSDVDRILTTLPPIVDRLRALSPVPVDTVPDDYVPWLSRDGSA